MIAKAQHYSRLVKDPPEVPEQEICRNECQNGTELVNLSSEEDASTVLVRKNSRYKIQDTKDECQNDLVNLASKEDASPVLVRKNLSIE